MSLAGALIARGHVVRATTRRAERVAEIEAAGAETLVADPDRIVTVAPALEHVAVVCVLLGSASGAAAQLEALHATRLDMLLTRILDSTVRGFIYEAAGTVDPEVLGRGAARVRAFCEDSRIPYGLIDADPTEPHVWLDAAARAVDGVLKPRITPG
jgi:nucleoside-diphosphate-sugar epimerase